MVYVYSLVFVYFVLLVACCECVCDVFTIETNASPNCLRVLGDASVLHKSSLSWRAERAN